MLGLIFFIIVGRHPDLNPTFFWLSEPPTDICLHGWRNVVGDDRWRNYDVNLYDIVTNSFSTRSTRLSNMRFALFRGKKNYLWPGESYFPHRRRILRM